MNRSIWNSYLKTDFISGLFWVSFVWVCCCHGGRVDVWIVCDYKPEIFVVFNIIVTRCLTYIINFFNSWNGTNRIAELSQKKNKKKICLQRKCSITEMENKNDVAFPEKCWGEGIYISFSIPSNIMQYFNINLTSLLCPVNLKFKSYFR